MPIATAADNSQNQPAGLSARNAAVVTPDDDTDLAEVTRGVFVGGAGNLNVNMAGTGTSLTITGIAAGTFLPISVARIRSTSTTATNIVAFW
jgi:hypothetical protein